MDGSSLYELFLVLAILLLACLALALYWFAALRRPLHLTRLKDNPVLRPDATHWWESQAVFNPGALVHDGRVHLFYRAMGADGISRVGHASSADGIHFDERSAMPVFDKKPEFYPPPKVSYATLTYNTDTYASGGGWGGVEDPRAVTIDDRIYMTFSVFEGWQSIRLGITSLAHADLDARRFSAWAPYIPISPKGQTHKNWVLFPEKINEKFAILHSLVPKVMVEYVDTLDELHENPIQSKFERAGRKGKWDALIRGAGAPPIKTEYGWLLLYHGMDPERHTGYQVGAMVLDLHDPTKILYQSDQPVLSPKEWYENDWKPGVVYASGAVVFNGELYVYYGGGDKYIAAAHTNMREFMRKLTTHQHAVLEPVEV